MQYRKIRVGIMKKRYKKIIIGAVAVVIIIAACFVSFDKFRTFNFIRGSIGFAQIMLTDAEYVEIQKSPRVVLTKSENNREIFIELIKSEGYEYVEQMGSGHIIEKDGEREFVISNYNGYFTRWSWSE